MSLPQPLMFTVGMIDQITKPIAKVSNSLNGLTNDYQRGTMKMASGVAGIAASGYALQNALMPAIEMDRALGEVKSLGVRESALKQLTDTSYEFALKYGKSSTEFVKSSYDIQSAIAGLNDADLSAFTLSGNVLAAATKADAATITDYMGTMYGTFKNEAESMGKGEWVQQLTGMTATAVQVFKTDGKKMADAFKGMSGASKEALSDQMAILGTLQSTLGGGESATQYKAFLGGAAKAQEKLGMNFTDQYGKLLPTIEILEKLKGKYGDLTIASDRLEIKEAFGTDQALGFIDLLSKDTDALRVNMDALGKVKGMEQAEKMASAMTDQSERLSQSWYVIRAALGSAILPAFNDFVGLIADMGSGVLSFTEEFPTLTKWLGYAAVGVLAFVAAGGLISVVMGASIMAMTAWSAIIKTGKWLNAAWTASVTVMRAAMFALNLVMAANPILLIVAGITLAIAAVGALIYYWDDLKASFADISWVNVLLTGLEYAWKAVEFLFAPLLWAIEELASLAGIEIDTSFEGVKGLIGLEKVPATQPQASSIPSIAAISPVQSRVERGGITQQISNANQQKSTHIASVTINPAKGDTNYMNFVEMHS
ncbi:phage tail tape measure protein [Pseudoalteromonas sp. SD03]|uniref:Phage tail tape measure protein n=1 Tax=Pseudoalteromonas sp. SD03 TaxID=3231719 RepID=A0AB39ARA8_9GAMM